MPLRQIVTVNAKRFLSGAVVASPVRELTPIDEALGSGGNVVEEFNQGVNNRLLQKLHEAKSPDVTLLSRAHKTLMLFTMTHVNC